MKRHPIGAMDILRVLILCGVIGGIHGGSRAPKGPLKLKRPCPPLYKRYSKHTHLPHTYCYYKKIGITIPVTNDDIKFILKYHNDKRMDPFPDTSAKHMSKIYWDPKMAEIAEYFAASCPHMQYDHPLFGHDLNRDVPGYGTVLGQNIAWTGMKQAWEMALKTWFIEYKNFKFGVGRINKRLQVEHYTTMVAEKTSRVGCGLAKCRYKYKGSKRMWKTFICNYGPSQPKGASKEPFARGKSCEGCPDHCVDGKLCDTRGKFCYNRGTLDYKTNTCHCLPQYTGTNCETLTCYGDHFKACRGPRSVNCNQMLYFSMSCPQYCKVCSKDCKAGKYYFESPEVELTDETGKIAHTYTAGSLKVLPGQEQCQKMKMPKPKMVKMIKNNGEVPKGNKSKKKEKTGKNKKKTKKIKKKGGKGKKKKMPKEIKKKGGKREDKIITKDIKKTGEKGKDNKITKKIQKNRGNGKSEKGKMKKCRRGGKKKNKKRRKGKNKRVRKKGKKKKGRPKENEDVILSRKKRSARGVEKKRVRDKKRRKRKKNRRRKKNKKRRKRKKKRGKRKNRRRKINKRGRKKRKKKNCPKDKWYCKKWLKQRWCTDPLIEIVEKGDEGHPAPVVCPHKCKVCKPSRRRGRKRKNKRGKKIRKRKGRKRKNRKGKKVKKRRRKRKNRKGKNVKKRRGKKRKNKRGKKVKKRRGRKRKNKRGKKVKKRKGRKRKNKKGKKVKKRRGRKRKNKRRRKKKNKRRKKKKNKKRRKRKNKRRKKRKNKRRKKRKEDEIAKVVQQMFTS